MFTNTTNALARTRNTPARAANARMGAHDGRWVTLDQIKTWLAMPTTPGTRAERAIVAGALRNGRVRLSPKAAKYATKALALPHEQAHEAVAEWLSPR